MGTLRRGLFVSAALALCALAGCASAPPPAVVHVADPPPAPPLTTTEPEDEPAPEKPQTRRAPPEAAPAGDLHDDEQRAKHLFQEGAEAYANGDYLRAREKFQAAYDLVPLPALLFNIGSAEMRLGNVSAGCAIFRKYVAGGDPADPRIQEVQQQVANRCRNVP